MITAPPEPLSPFALRTATEEWLVAATIATEVPPNPIRSPHSKDAWTAEAIPLAIRAVAEVILNRSLTAGFPDTALGVVLQIKQFSGVLRGLTLAQVGHRDIWLDAVCGDWFPAHVSRCLAEWRRVLRSSAHAAPGALYYYSPVGMRPPGSVPAWADGRTVVPVVGVPIDWFSFYR